MSTKKFHNTNKYNIQMFSFIAVLLLSKGLISEPNAINECYSTVEYTVKNQTRFKIHELSQMLNPPTPYKHPQNDSVSTFESYDVKQAFICTFC